VYQPWQRLLPTCRGRCRKPASRSCGGSTDGSWSSLSPARGCCEACWPPRGAGIGRRDVKTLMRRMGMEALYRRPRTTKPEPGTRSIRICCAAITRPNQGWAMDITYIPMEHGFVYLGVSARLVQVSRAVAERADLHGVLSRSRSHDHRRCACGSTCGVVIDDE
jgi:hypothetical protein